MTKPDPRKDYLVGKMIDGASALYDFFDVLINNRKISPQELSNNLAERYELTNNQKNYLRKVATRATKAKGIVNYLEERFGLDGNEFEDPQGLYKLLFSGKELLDGSTAKSYNVAIGIVKPKWYHKRNVGFASRFHFDQLDLSLEQTLDRLENNRVSGCKNLTFTMPAIECIDRQMRNKKWSLPEKLIEEEKLLKAIFGPDYDSMAKKYQKSIESHELRHVHDFIINNYSTVFLETPASLYEKGDFLEGLSKDYNNEMLRIDKSIKTNRRLLSLDPTKQLVESAQKSLKKLKKEAVRTYFNFNSLGFAHHLNGIPINQMRKASYLFSDLDLKKGLKRLKLIADFYRNSEK